MNIKELPVFYLQALQPEPAVRPDCAKCMIPDFYNTKGNHGGFIETLVP